MEEILTNPFTIGLAVGLGVGVMLALATWISGVFRHRTLRKETGELRKHLNMQMSITAKGNEELQKELESLRQQNENLRITVNTLQQKPGRAEIRTLHIYDRAVNLMRQRAPGFAPAWEEVLQEAETEVKNAEGGFGKLLKKVFRPSLISESSGPPKNDLAPEKEEEKEPEKGMGT
jgi:hypothetical protein